MTKIPRRKNKPIVKRRDPDAPIHITNAHRWESVCSIDLGPRLGELCLMAGDEEVYAQLYPNDDGRADIASGQSTLEAIAAAASELSKAAELLKKTSELLSSPLYKFPIKKLKLDGMDIVDALLRPPRQRPPVLTDRERERVKDAVDEYMQLANAP